MPSSTVLKNGQSLEIREARTDDAAQLLVFVEQVSGETSFHSIGPGEFDLSAEQEANFLRGCQASSNQTYVLGFVDDELVATASVMASPRPRLRHRGDLGMSVRRSFWGLGIGTAMLDHLIEWTQENPMLTKLDLRVREDNTIAIALYRGRGFDDEGVLCKQVCFEGVFYDLIAMGIEV